MPTPTQAPVSFSETLRRMLRLALLMALSYDFSFMLFLIPILALASADEDADGNSAMLAAIPLIVTMLNVLVSGAGVNFVALRIFISRLYGRLEALENEAQEGTENTEQIVAVRQEISAGVRNTLLFTAVATAVAIPMAFSGPLLVNGFGQDPATAALVQRFTRPYALAMPALVARIVFENTLLGLNATTPVMLIGLGSFLVSTGLSYALGTQLGLDGVAYGYVVGAYFTCVGLGLYLALHRDFAGFDFFSGFSLTQADRARIRELAGSALVLFSSFVNDFAALLATSLLAGLLGENELAASAFASQLSFFSLIVIFALSQAAGQLFGRARGAGDYALANRMAVRGLGIGMGVMAIPSLIAVAYPQSLVYLIGGNAPSSQVLALALPVARIQALALLFGEAPRYIMLQVTRDADYGPFPTFVSIACLWGGVGAARLLGESFGLNGIAAGYALGVVGGALFIMPMFLRTIQPEFLALPREERPSQPLFAGVLSVLQGGRGRAQSEFEALRGASPTPSV